MNYSLGIPKGMRAVLEERWINTRNMNADKMREVLGSHPDFKNKKSTMERFLGDCVHAAKISLRTKPNWMGMVASKAVQQGLLQLQYFVDGFSFYGSTCLVAL